MLGTRADKVHSSLKPGFILVLSGVVALAVLAWAAHDLMEREVTAHRWVAHTFEVLGTISGLEGKLADISAEGRAYVQNGDAESKHRFEAAKADTWDRVAALQRLVADNPVQQDALDQLSPLIEARIGVIHTVLDLLGAGNRAEAEHIFAGNPGRRFMDQIIVVTNAMRQEEKRLLADRQATAQHARLLMLAAMLTACGLMVTVSVLYAAVLMAARRREHQRTAELAAAQERLHVNETRFRLLTEHASDVVSYLDVSGTRTYISPVASRLFGVSAEALLRDGCENLIFEEDRPVVQAERRRLMAGETEAIQFTFRVRHPVHGDIWIEESIHAAHEAETNRFHGYVSVARDVTERKRLEMELASHLQAMETSNTRLERLARHLDRARLRAQEASLAKSNFLAGISHELRTPLNGILGYAHLLQRDGELTPKQISRVSAMIGAGQHLLKMINRVLDMSEIEAGQVSISSNNVDLRHIVHACCDVVRPLAEAKELQLVKTVVPGTPCILYTDETRLRQVILNLLGNAVKFTSRGKIELRLGAAPAGSIVRIEIADTGPGIPANQRDRLFRNFDRLDATASEGAGLGLALSSRLAQAMGASIGYDDNPGGGSIFWVELPVVADTTEPAMDEVQASEGVVPQVAEAWRILVVDDVAMNLDIAGSFLRSAGHDVTCVESGSAAIEAASQTRFDAILMDVRMPEMDGLEAAHRIRALPEPHGAVPIIALTAQAFADQISKCRAAGMEDHLSKPFTPDALLQVVARAITARGSSTAQVTERPDTAAGMPAPRAARPAASVVTAPVNAELPLLDLPTYQCVAEFLCAESAAAHAVTLVQKLEGVLRSLRDPGALTHEAAALVEEVHAAAGSAGLFGFKRFAAAGRDFERAVQNAEPAQAVLLEALIATTEASLRQLHDSKLTVPAQAHQRDAMPATHGADSANSSAHQC